MSRCQHYCIESELKKVENDNYNYLYDKKITIKYQNEDAVRELLTDANTKMLNLLGFSAGFPDENGIKEDLRSLKNITSYKTYARFEDKFKNMISNELIYELFKLWIKSYKDHQDKENEFEGLNDFNDENKIRKGTKFIQSLYIKCTVNFINLSDTNGGGFFGSWLCSGNKCNVEEPIKKEYTLHELYLKFIQNIKNFWNETWYNLDSIGGKEQEVVNYFLMLNYIARNLPKNFNNNASKIGGTPLGPLVSQGFTQKPSVARRQSTTTLRPASSMTVRPGSQKTLGTIMTQLPGTPNPLSVTVNSLRGDFGTQPPKSMPYNATKFSNIGPVNVYIGNSEQNNYEYDLLIEINDRIQNLNSIYELLTTTIDYSSGTSSLVPKTIGELLLIDSSVINDEIIEINNAIKQSNTSNGQYGGNNTKYNSLITQVYKLDVKNAKYEQMISYRAYFLYQDYIISSKNTSNEQNGGGLGEFIVRIHETYKNFTLVEKYVGLQSLSKGLLVYLFKKVFQKMKIPDEIAGLFEGNTDKDIIFNAIKIYLARQYSEYNILQYRLRISETSLEKDAELIKTYTEILDGLIAFGNLISMFSTFNTVSNYDTVLSASKDLKNTIDSLSQVKDNISQTAVMGMDMSKNLKHVNPQMYDKDKSYQYKQDADNKKKIKETVRMYEYYKTQLEKNPENQNYQDYLNNFEKKLLDLKINLSEQDQTILDIIEGTRRLYAEILTIFMNTIDIAPAQIEQLKKTGEKLVGDIVNSSFIKNGLNGIKNAFTQFLSSTPWLQSITHVLSYLSPFLVMFETLLLLAPIGLIITVINLSIAALHYTIRLSIFFWRKYTKKDNFDIDKFLNDLKGRGDNKQNGGKQRKYRLAKNVSRKRNSKLRGGTILPSIRPIIRKENDKIKQTSLSLPSIQGVKLPIIQRSINRDNDEDIEILTEIAETIICEVSKYSKATQEKYKLSPNELQDMVSALEMLINSDTFDMNDIYKNTQYGGKLRRLKRISKKVSALESKTKKELFVYAKSKGLNVKSSDKKNDIIQEIIRKKK